MKRMVIICLPPVLALACMVWAIGGCPVYLVDMGSYRLVVHRACNLK